MIFRYELRKMLFCRRGLIIPVLICLQIALSFFRPQEEHDYSVEVYRKYTSEYEGTYSTRTGDVFRLKKENAEALIAEHASVVDRYNADEMTLEEFHEYNLKYTVAKNELYALSRIVDRCDYYESLNGETFLFFDTEWEDFFSSGGFDYLIAIGVLVLAIPVFCGEYSSGARSVLISSCRGRRETAAIKLLSVAVFSLLFSLIMYAVKAAPLMCGESGRFGSLPVYSLPGFRDAGDASMLMYYCMQSVIRAFAWVEIAVFVCAVSVMTGSQVVAFFIAFVFTVCPAVAGKMFSASALPRIFSAALIPVGDVSMAAAFILAVKTVFLSAYCVHVWSRNDR